MFQNFYCELTKIKMFRCGPSFKVIKRWCSYFMWTKFGMKSIEKFLTAFFMQLSSLAIFRKNHYLQQLSNRELEIYFRPCRTYNNSLMSERINSLLINFIFLFMILSIRMQVQRSGNIFVIKYFWRRARTTGQVQPRPSLILNIAMRGGYPECASWIEA